MRLLVTGGAGFIGSALVRHLLSHTEHQVINVDKLTYAGNLASLGDLASHARYRFAQLDICQYEAMVELMLREEPTAILHLAAETHVDRSIDGAEDFVRTNVLGTQQLLQAATAYLARRPGMADAFRFIHVSTDEVYGDLAQDQGPVAEGAAYAPSSPYAASKAASDHLVRAWHRTHGLPTIVTNCTNNYGPYQFPEKLLPVLTLAAAQGRPLPLYGDGQQVRDWLFVEDHVRALLCVLDRGRIGETYHISAQEEVVNREIAHLVCTAVAAHTGGCVDELLALITSVRDRPGHDRRYALDASRLRRELDWQPRTSLQAGIQKTVSWYLDNPQWCQHVMQETTIAKVGVAT